MREVGELRLVVRFQNGADHVLQELIRPRRYAERPRFPILFRDVNSTHRGPSITFISKLIDNPVDFPHRHSIHGFGCHPLGHGPVVTIEPTVGVKEQLRFEQLSIDISQRQPSPTALLDDVKYRFGVTHLAHLPVLYIEWPVPLRHVPGFPRLRLLRGLRCRGARAR